MNEWLVGFRGLDEVDDLSWIDEGIEVNEDSNEVDDNEADENEDNIEVDEVTKTPSEIFPPSVPRIELMSTKTKSLITSDRFWAAERNSLFPYGSKMEQNFKGTFRKGVEFRGKFLDSKFLWWRFLFCA